MNSAGEFRYARGMTGIPHVTRSPSGIYKYRRVVPKPLREAIGKSVIKESLGKNLADAERLAAKRNAEVDQEFAEARAKLAPPEIPEFKGVAGLSRSQMFQVWERYRTSGDACGLDEVALREIKEAIQTPPGWDKELSYQEAVRLAGVWLSERLAQDEADLATRRSPNSGVRQMLAERGVPVEIPEKFPIIYSDVPLEHEDVSLLRRVAHGNPELALDILKAGKVGVDFAGCQSEDDRLERILLAMVADAGLSHAPVELEIDWFCLNHELNPNPDGNGYRYLKHAIARAWLTALRERRRKQAGDWSFPLPKDIG